MNDAFGSAHRAHASTEGITHFLKPAVAGLLMEKEITYLGKALEAPEKPFVAIIGGSKISDKIDVIQNLLDKVDTLVIVGGMAYTFQRALGIKTGKSLVEEDKIDVAKAALEKAKSKRRAISCCPSTTFWPTTLPRREDPDLGLFKDFPAEWQGLDIGPKSIVAIEKVVASTRRPSFGTALPGVFEFPRFRGGHQRHRQSGRGEQAARSRSSAAATRVSARSTRPVLQTRSRTSRPAAAQAWSSLKARSCPAWKR